MRSARSELHLCNPIESIGGIQGVKNKVCYKKKILVENRRLLQDRGILSRIFETAATARRQVGVMLVHAGKENIVGCTNSQWFETILLE